MSDARIVTDSSADLSSEAVEELGITVVPLGIRMGRETLVESPGLRSIEFHRRMARNDTVAIAVPPTARQFADAYGQLARQASRIVSIHLSSCLSDTVRAAREGSVGCSGRCQVSVIDSQVVSRALGILVTEAAKAARDGAAAQEIVRMLRGMIPRTYLAFYVRNPDYLRRTIATQRSRATRRGRITSPLLTMEEGEIIYVRRLRGRGTALERLVEFVAEFRELKKLCILHSGLVPEVEELKARLADLLPRKVTEEHIYGPTLGTYIGPEALGIVAFEG